MKNSIPNKHIVNAFRYISLAEGVSFLLLLLIAMPLKYAFDFPLAVKYTGWAHGLLFILYYAAAYLAAKELNWKFWRMVLAFMAALLPFGPFVFDRSVKREYEQQVSGRSQSSDR